MNSPGVPESWVMLWGRGEPHNFQELTSSQLDVTLGVVLSYNSTNRMLIEAHAQKRGGGPERHEARAHRFIQDVKRVVSSTCRHRAGAHPLKHRSLPSSSRSPHARRRTRLPRYTVSPDRSIGAVIAPAARQASGSKGGAQRGVTRYHYGSRRVTADALTTRPPAHRAHGCYFRPPCAL
jgi:phage gp37-like protein